MCSKKDKPLLNTGLFDNQLSAVCDEFKNLTQPLTFVSKTEAVDSKARADGEEYDDPVDIQILRNEGILTVNNKDMKKFLSNTNHVKPTAESTKANSGNAFFQRIANKRGRSQWADLKKEQRSHVKSLGRPDTGKKATNLYGVIQNYNNRDTSVNDTLIMNMNATGFGKSLSAGKKQKYVLPSTPKQIYTNQLFDNLNRSHRIPIKNKITK